MDKNNQEKTEIAQKIADRKTKISSNFSIIEEYFLKFFRFVSSIIDDFMFSSKYLGIASLLLTLLLYFLFGVDENSITKALSSSKTLSSVNIVTRYNSESFEVSGVPTKCDVIITGDTASVSNSAANKNGYCSIDLEGYTEGTHYVKVSALGYGDNVTATAVPSNAQVTLKRKTTTQFKLGYDYINTNQLDSKYILSEPEFNDGVDYVNIRASQDTLNSISLVKALIDVKGQTGDFTVDAPLIAYNSRGQQVDAEIVPNTVKATVKLTSHSKTVPITLKVKGNPPAGFGVDLVTMDQQSTEIFGLEKDISGIKSVSVELDLSTITSNTTLMQPIILPTGVTSSTVSVVNIKVVLDTVLSKTFTEVPLNYNKQGYTETSQELGVLNSSSFSTDVTVNATASVLDKLTQDNIYAYIETAGLQEGTYDLPIFLDKKDTEALFTMTCEPQSIQITLVQPN